MQLDDAVERADLEAQKAQAALAQPALNRALELQKRGVGSDVNARHGAGGRDGGRRAGRQAAGGARPEAARRRRFGGTVGIPRIDVGQYLAPGTSSRRCRTSTRCGSTSPCPSSSSRMLKIGQPVALRRSSGGDMPFSGKIIGIDPKIDPATRLVAVRGEVANPMAS